MSEPTVGASGLILRFRRLLTIALQLGLVVFSNWMAFRLRFDNAPPPLAVAAFWQMLPWLVAIRGASFVPFRLYEGLWRYTSIYDLRALAAGVLTSTVLFYAVAKSPLGPELYPRSIFITDAVLLILLLGGIRLGRRLMVELPRVEPGKRVLIVGAGDAGELIVRQMRSIGAAAYQPIGFIDDNRGKVGRRIHGVPVLGTRNDLPEIIDRYKPSEILIAIPRADAQTVRAIVRALEPFKVPIKTLPNLRDILGGKVDTSSIRSLSVDDLLARAPVGLDPKPLQRLIAGRRVMVTGAGGSIGSELCRQIARFKPESLVMFERYENTLHAIRLELDDAHVSFGAIPVIGDVTDAARLDEVLRTHRPEIIFHAAAHKHVPLMEENPCEAIKNNVRGTRLLARAATAAGVDRVILISTDKAVNPTSVMGASKRLAELALQLEPRDGRTSFAVVRFGNVLGSNGSVVPRFLEQIHHGGPVTITHPEIRRFFMLIPEAVQLVLHAAAQAESGATYVLDMGEQVKVLDMARDLIRLAGFVPDEDIKIEFVGLRPGEKLYEELVGEDEVSTPSRVEKILCVRATRPVRPGFAADLDRLEEDAAAGRVEAVHLALTAVMGGGDRRALETQVASAAESRLVSQAELDEVARTLALLPDGEQPCPVCPTGRLRRSRARNLGERIRRVLSPRRPFRCNTCKWRGWVLPRYMAPTPLENPNQPVLTALDHLGASTGEPESRRSGGVPDTFARG